MNKTALNFIVLWLSLVSLGLAVTALHAKLYTPLSGLMLIVWAGFSWIHADELAAHFPERSKPFPLLYFVGGFALSAVGLAWELL
jgi:hypothetical protein